MRNYKTQDFSRHKKNSSPDKRENKLILIKEIGTLDTTRQDFNIRVTNSLQVNILIRIQGCGGDKEKTVLCDSYPLWRKFSVYWLLLEQFQGQNIPAVDRLEYMGSN